MQVCSQPSLNLKPLIIRHCLVYRRDESQTEGARHEAWDKQPFSLNFLGWSERDGQHTGCPGIVPSHPCAFHLRMLTYGISLLGGGSHGYAGMQFTEPARKLHHEILCVTCSRLFKTL